jgi:hypothetical protein
MYRNFVTVAPARRPKAPPRHEPKNFVGCHKVGCHRKRKREESMVEKSLKIIEKLKKLALDTDFKMNVHRSVCNLDKTLRKIDEIYSNMTTKGSTSGDSTEQLQELHHQLLDNAYRFLERLKIFLKINKSKLGTMTIVFDKLQTILQETRGSDTHLKEPLFTYELSDGTNFTCYQNGPFPDNYYSGEVDDVDIEYKEKNGSSRSSYALTDLINDIRLWVDGLLSQLETQVQ